MKVTNVSVKLAPESGDRLKAFCTMTVDDEFVVRDLKVIEGTSGMFVAMPSRKLTDHCPKCGGKNHLRARFCNDCGAKLPENRTSDEEAQGKLHADVAHPINSECRNRIQGVILDAYREELRRTGREQEAVEVDRELGDAPPPEASAPPAKPAAPEAQAAPPEQDEARPESAATEPGTPAPDDDSGIGPGEAEPPEQPSGTDPSDAGGTGGQEQGGQDEQPGQGHIFGEGIL